MNKVRRVLHHILTTSLNTDQMNHLGRDVDPNFSITRVSGFGDKIVIPRKVAADCIIDYFNKDEHLIEFINYMISREGFGGSGGLIKIRGMDRLLTVLREHHWVFDEKEKRFHRDQSRLRTTDWGFMREGEEYYHSFASIDMVLSSELVQNNLKQDIDITMARLRNYVYSHVEQENGRMWSWFGDGGMAVFFGEETINHAMVAMIRILSFLPIFNIAHSELHADSDIRLRIGLHYGKAVYQQDSSRILSPDMNLAMEVEKNCARPNTIAITETLHRSLKLEVRARLAQISDYKNMQIYLYTPE